MRLGDLFTGDLTWRQLGVYIRQLPRDSALARALAGDDHVWDLHAHLLAVAADALHVANWQRSARKGARPPKPIPRPGTERHKQRNGQRTGGTTRSPEEVARVLARIGPRRTPII